MIWIAFLIGAFLVIGLRRRMPSTRRHWLVVTLTSLAMAVVYLGLVNP